MSILTELSQRLKALFAGVEKTAKADEAIVTSIIAKDRAAVDAALKVAADAAVAAVKADAPEVEAVAKAAAKQVVDAVLAQLARLPVVL